jgi:DNA-directed RNA polymerase alpha subunit
MPQLKNKAELNGVLQFTLYDIHHSVANAIRRTILEDIPSVVIKTFPDELNQCNIIKNTTRFHNEIIKQRLSCIPIHLKPDEKMNLDVLELHLHKKNDSKTIEFITTEDFEMTNAGNKVDKKTLKQMFKPFVHKGKEYYIDIVKLRPPLSDNIPGEELELTAKLQVGTPKDSGMYNVVSTCFYVFTQDIKAANKAWESKKHTLKGNEEEIEIIKKNWYLLDAKRFTIDSSFEFTIETIGIYENNDIVMMACEIIQKQLRDFIEGNNYEIKENDTTMKNSIDIVLSNGNYTIGKILEYQFYKNMFPKLLSYVSFFKVHPHLTEGIIRLAFNDETSETTLIEYFVTVCKVLIDEFNDIHKLFKK